MRLSRRSGCGATQSCDTGLPAIAREWNSRGIVTPRGGAWHPSSVRNLLGRLGDAR
ncbi:MAG: recombinase family protein [Sphingomonas taxi]